MTRSVFFGLAKHQAMASQLLPYCGALLWSVRHATPAGMLKL
jgi:hypothetical protein